MVVKAHTIHQRVLVINPNTSASLTDSFRPILSALPISDSITLSYWTCPTGPAMIKSTADMHESVSHCLPLLLKLAPDYDGFLAACYADHPLVRLLQSHVGKKPVVGIFDASVYAALRLLPPGSRFGIVTTGVAYEKLLTKGVTALLGQDERELAQFAGVAASGIGLADLKYEDADDRHEAKGKVLNATARLLQSEGTGPVLVICMGGAILAGMEGWVHEACESTLGADEGNKVKVVDQLAAGMLTLDALLYRKSFQTVDYHHALK